jgi:hypothetical protein
MNKVVVDRRASAAAACEFASGVYRETRKLVSQ